MIAYLVTNLVNGKRYVGISSRKTPNKRWGEHVSAAKRGGYFPLYQSIREHGAHNFTVETIACARSWDDLCALERQLIAQYGTCSYDHGGYNMTRGGDGRYGTPHTAETRAKMSKAATGRKMPAEAVAKTRAANLGRKLSPEHREKLAKVRARNADQQRGRSRAPEIGLKISAALRGRIVSPERRERLIAILDEARNKNNGKPMSEIARAKLSAARRGTKLSDETRAKISAAGKARYERQRQCGD